MKAAGVGQNTQVQHTFATQSERLYFNFNAIFLFPSEKVMFHNLNHGSLIKAHTERSSHTVV